MEIDCYCLWFLNNKYFDLERAKQRVPNKIPVLVSGVFEKRPNDDVISVVIVVVVIVAVIKFQDAVVVDVAEHVAALGDHFLAGRGHLLIGSEAAVAKHQARVVVKYTVLSRML